MQRSQEPVPRSPILFAMRSLIGLAMVVSLLLTTLAARAQTPAPQPAPEATGIITITCAMPGALVFVDHTLVGKAPLNASVVAGPHEVRVSAGEDFVPFVQNVTVVAGATIAVEAVLQPTAPTLYRDALAAFKAGRNDEAAQLFERAAAATGKRAAEIPFYQGLLAVRAKDFAAAQRYLVAWVNVSPASATGQYQLGRVRQALHQDALAATAYKNALLAGVSGAAAIIASAGKPTTANVAHHEALAKVPGADAATASLQLAYLYELKGSVVLARDRYRSLFESLMSTRKIDLLDPSPSDLPMALPHPATANLPAAPVNTVYVTGDNAGAVAAAWRIYVQARATLAGPALIGGPHNHWITLQARVFDTASQDQINTACQALSAALKTDVLFLQITKDGRSWYFYWNDGQMLDRYCSNPGHADEVDYKTLRSWAGKPEVLARLARGRPLSSKSAAPSITDLNAILYFYYPELQQTKPGSWRTPATFMKTLAGILGIDDLPSRYSDRGAQGGPYHSL